jgi:hypothetical protein
LTARWIFIYDWIEGEGKVKYKSQLVFSIILLFVVSGCDRPKLTGVEFEKIDTSQDPRQTPYRSEESISRTIEGGFVSMTPLAEYRVSGVVVSKKSYSDDWEGEIAPVDLAIAWGKLPEPEFDRYITFSHSHRWYHYKWKEGSPFDTSYVIAHSANNHIIPASENIRRALKVIKKKDQVVLEGYLVNLKGTYKGREVAWNTSMSRKDTGNGSCELFYVSKVRIDKRVYE